MADDILYLLNKRVKLQVQPGGFRPGLDSVMLAAACPAQGQDRILDLGCGVGSAGLCVVARQPDIRLTGIDIQQDAIDLAIQNGAHNQARDAGFMCQDIKDFSSGNFDHVIANPPFGVADEMLNSPDHGKAMANAHFQSDLGDWVTCAFDAIGGRGSLTMVHRADHTDKIIYALGKRFGAMEIIPLWPKIGQPAHRVIIRARKHRQSGLTLHPGIVLHQEDGSFTVAANIVLKDAKTL